MSAHSLYAWKQKFAKPLSGEIEKDAKIRRLKRELVRMLAERDILKRAIAYFTRDTKRDTPLWPSIEGGFQCGRCRCLCIQRSESLGVTAGTAKRVGTGRQSPD